MLPPASSAAHFHTLTPYPELSPSPATSSYLHTLTPYPSLPESSQFPESPQMMSTTAASQDSLAQSLSSSMVTSTGTQTSLPSGSHINHMVGQLAGGGTGIILKSATPTSITQLHLATPTNTTQLHLATPTSATQLHLAMPTSTTQFRLATPTSGTQLHLATPTSATQIHLSPALLNTLSSLVASSSGSNSSHVVHQHGLGIYIQGSI